MKMQLVLQRHASEGVCSLSYVPMPLVGEEGDGIGCMSMSPHPKPRSARLKSASRRRELRTERALTSNHPRARLTLSIDISCGYPGDVSCLQPTFHNLRAALRKARPTLMSRERKPTTVVTGKTGPRTICELEKRRSDAISRACLSARHGPKAASVCIWHNFSWDIHKVHTS